jgi:hypothetical protein
MLRAGTSNKSDLGGVVQTSNIHIVTCGTAKAKAKFILATDGVDFESAASASSAIPAYLQVADFTICSWLCSLVIQNDECEVDASLRYTPPPKTEFYKTAVVYHLILAPTHWTMFKADGKVITGTEERTGPDEWQIQEPAGLPWTTVNTAVRYVLERRERSKDQVIRKNADETLSRLLKLH